MAIFKVQQRVPFQLKRSIRLIFAAKIAIAPCIRIQFMPYESARSYPNTFFSSEFLASILYLTLALVLNLSVFSKSACF